jgi:hypothetical protein
LVVLGFEFGIILARQALYFASLFVLGIFQLGSHSYLPKAGFNPDPPDLSLLIMILFSL